MLKSESVLCLPPDPVYCKLSLCLLQVNGTSRTTSKHIFTESNNLRMYQLAPISLRPEVRASRSQHGQFQNKINSIVERVIGEVEVVDMSNKAGKALFNLIDKFFSYGLYTSDQAYWKFVREFLPKTEQHILKAEWGDVNDRRMSIAWLKDAFNKGTIAFQIMAFKGTNSKKVIARFYHPNACMMNGGMLEAVGDMMEKLVTVQFAFYSRVNLREEPAQAVVVQAPSTPAAKVLKARRRLDWEADNVPVVPNIAAPDPTEYMVGTPAEQEIVLDRILRNKINRNRLNSERFSITQDDNTVADAVPARPSEKEQPKVTERFDEVLTKVSSRVRMEHLLDEPKSFDQMLLDDTKPLKTEEESLVEGEEFVDSSDILQLAMNVFIEQGERPIKMYHVFDKFAVGVPCKRLFAITQHNMYTISKTLTPDSSGPATEGPSNIIYMAHCIIPLDALDSIDISLDYQQIIFYPKGGHEFTYTEGNTKEDFVSIGTGDRNLGRSILHSIQHAYSTTGKAPPSLLMKDSPQDMILKRYLSKELPLENLYEAKHLSLVFWKETCSGIQTQGIDHSGYLYWRFNQTNWWRRPQNDFDQCFFLLRQDRKIYMFKDSSMKEGIQIYDLRNCVETLEMDQKKDYQWSFEVVFAEGNLQLLSQSKEDLVKWMQLISSALTMPDEEEASAAMCLMTQSHIAIAQEGARCIHDGFIRTLTSFALTDIQSAWVLKGGEGKLLTTPHAIMIFRVHGNYEWIFFRSEMELDRMRESLASLPVDLKEITSIEEQTRDSAALISIAQRCPDLWGKPVYDSDAAEAYEN